MEIRHNTIISKYDKYKYDKHDNVYVYDIDYVLRQLRMGHLCFWHYAHCSMLSFDVFLSNVGNSRYPIDLESAKNLLLHNKSYDPKVLNYSVHRYVQ